MPGISQNITNRLIHFFLPQWFKLRPMQFWGMSKLKSTKDPQKCSVSRHLVSRTGNYRLRTPFHIKVIMFSQLICLVVWNMNFILPYIGNNHTNWLSYFSKGLKPPTSHPIFGASSLVKHPFALKDAEKATINEKGLWCYHQMYETKWKKA